MILPPSKSDEAPRCMCGAFPDHEGFRDELSYRDGDHHGCQRYQDLHFLAGGPARGDVDPWRGVLVGHMCVLMASPLVERGRDGLRPLDHLLAGRRALFEEHFDALGAKTRVAPAARLQKPVRPLSTLAPGEWYATLPDGQLDHFDPHRSSRPCRRFSPQRGAGG